MIRIFILSNGQNEQNSPLYSSIFSTHTGILCAWEERLWGDLQFPYVQIMCKSIHKQVEPCMRETKDLLGKAHCKPLIPLAIKGNKPYESVIGTTKTGNWNWKWVIP